MGSSAQTTKAEAGQHQRSRLQGTWLGEPMAKGKRRGCSGVQSTATHGEHPLTTACTGLTLPGQQLHPT